MPRTGSAQISLVGEAKCTNQPRTRSDLIRLAHIRDLMGSRAANAALVLFSRSGFNNELQDAAGADEVTLITLADMYRRDA
jgi:hypothetical protein